MSQQTGTQVTTMVAGAGNATLATALGNFQAALAAITPQQGSVVIINSGLECVSNSQATGVAFFQPWALVTYVSS